MARFTISTGKFGDNDTVILQDSASGAKAVFAKRGATLLTYHVPFKGKLVDITDGYATPEEFAIRKGGRAWIMAPFSNRVDDGKYNFDGKAHDLGVTDEKNRVILHGFVNNIMCDVTAQQADDRQARVTFTTSALRPGAFAGYPFSVDVSITYTLTGNRLDVEITGKNVGKEDAPFGCGWHPYFKTGENGINSLELSIPAATTIAVVEKRLLPLPGKDAYVSLDKAPQLDFRPNRPAGGNVLGTRVIDSAFTDLKPDADGWIRTRLFDPANGMTITVFQERGLMHVFTGDPLPFRPRHSVAMEPVECMTNAYNRPECAKAVLLPAGSHRTFRFGVEVTG